MEKFLHQTLDTNASSKVGTIPPRPRLLKHYDIWKRVIQAYFSDSYSYAILFVTSKCNARCKTCFNWQNIEHSGQRKELSLEEYKRISENFENLIYLSIGGGEPFLRTDLADIVHEFYKNSGVRFVTVTTNSLQPSQTKDTVLQILEQNPDIYLTVCLSLDGIDSLHDYIRGVKGNYEKVIINYRFLSELRKQWKNLSLNVSTIFNKYNQEHIFDIISYVKKNFDVNHNLGLVRGTARDLSSKDVLLERYFQALESLMDSNRMNANYFGIFRYIVRAMYKISRSNIEKRREMFPCVAGRKMITIDDEGNVKPCEMLEQIYPHERFEIGNLRLANYDIKKIRNSRRSRELRSFIKNRRCACTFENAILCSIIFNRSIYPILRYIR